MKTVSKSVQSFRAVVARGSSTNNYKNLTNVFNILSFVRRIIYVFVYAFTT